MKKYLLFFFLALTMGICFAGESKSVKELDVTGDGIKEKLYVKCLGGGTSIFYRPIIMSGSKNIFPRYYPSYFPLDQKKGNPIEIVFSSKGGCYADKFDNYTGKQILIYFVTDNLKINRINYTIIEGHLFRYNNKINMFEFYKKDLIYYDADFLQDIKNKKEHKKRIVCSFKTKTEYIQAFITAKKFLELLKLGQFKKAQEMCSFDLLEEISRHNKIRPNIDIQKAMSYYNIKTYQGYIDKENYFFDDGAWTACFSISVGFDNKIIHVIFPDSYYTF